MYITDYVMIILICIQNSVRAYYMMCAKTGSSLAWGKEHGAWGGGHWGWSVKYEGLPEITKI